MNSRLTARRVEVLAKAVLERVVMERATTAKVATAVKVVQGKESNPASPVTGFRSAPAREPVRSWRVGRFQP